MNLTDIANRCGTDKGTVHGAAHAYTIIYDLLLHALRDQPINLLEIGLYAGGPEVEGGSVSRDATDIPSIRMWHEYFPYARIYGLDISDFSKFETDWFRFFRADCGDEAQLREVVNSGVTFDVIIDDGSHASYHQQLAFKVLFPTVKPGGIYAIEDLNWQPREYETTLPASPKTADWLRDDVGEVVVLFDDDQLATARRSFNQRARLKPTMSHYVDQPTLRGRVRRVLEAVALRPPSTKLAVIRRP